MNRNSLERSRMASITPLMPSPGKPKMVSTPQRCRTSSNSVEALALMDGSRQKRRRVEVVEESAREHGEHVLGRAHGIRIVVLARVIDAWLFEEMFDGLIPHDHGVAPTPITESKVLAIHEHTHATSEMTRAVGNQSNSADAEMPAPLKHDERIVHTDAVDFIQPGLPQLIIATLISRALLARTHGSESTRQAEDRGTLAREKISSRDVLPPIRILTSDRLIAHTRLEDDLWQLATDHKKKLQE